MGAEGVPGLKAHVCPQASLEGWLHGPGQVPYPLRATLFPSVNEH